MSIRRWAWAPWVLTVALGAQAQTAAPAKPESKPDAKSDPKADEAAAAMERAKRMAAGPMRVILEASKTKRRVEGEAAATDSGSVRTVSVRGAPAPAAEPAPRPAAQQAAPAPAPAPTAVATPAPAPVASEPPTATPVTTQITLSSEALQSRSVAPVPGLERPGAVAPASLGATAPMPAVATEPVRPKLVNRVDPEVPQRVLDDMGRNAVVAVDVKIRTDGSVASVVFANATNPRLQRAITSAVEQWRFEPLPGERTHRIELLFNGE